MFKHSLLLLLWLFASGTVFAQASNITLFAVDLSLSAEDKAAAFDIISEITRNAPETQSVGLTLFDDTVRGYVAPASLDMPHIKALNQAIDGAGSSVNSTSNLAVGVERAIDAFSPESGANLVLFSRGVIDTETQDPRARFNEWLDLILLPQAAESNIAITLVVPQSLGPDPQITQAFGKSEIHQITSIASGRSISPELMSLLNIPDRAYGNLEAPEQVATGSPASVGEEITPQAIAQRTDTATERDLPMTRMILLAVASTLIIAILSWRYFSRSAPVANNDDPTMPSPTYLPLTEKPSDTMDYWREKETDLRVDKSTDANSSNSASTVARDSEKTQKR